MGQGYVYFVVLKIVLKKIAAIIAATAVSQRNSEGRVDTVLVQLLRGNQTRIGFLNVLAGCRGVARLPLHQVPYYFIRTGILRPFSKNRSKMEQAELDGRLPAKLPGADVSQQEENETFRQYP